MSKVYALLAEVRSIQEYLFAGGKLKDMVAASDRLDRLWGEVLDDIVAAAAIGEPEDVIRKGGGAYTAIFNNESSALKLKALLSAFVAHYLPDVQFLVAVVGGETYQEAVSAGYSRLAQIRNSVTPKFPPASPFAMINARTGEPAVERERYGDREEIDEATRTKRNHSDRLRKRSHGGSNAAGKTLESKFAPGFQGQWPVNMEEDFETLHGTDVAIIHADGNGLGLLLQKFNDIAGELDNKEYARLYRTFSEALEAACILAASEATMKILLNDSQAPHVMPMRPLVLGGDDLTVIIKADLALGFAQEFCLAFEANTKDMLARLKNKPFGARLKGLPERLTACAGIVFAKSGQPFLAAYHLSEALCKHAKDAGRSFGDRMPSAICFHRPGNSLLSSYEQALGSELCVRLDNERTLQLTMGAYALGAYHTSLPVHLEPLLAALDVLSRESIPVGPLRSMATTLFETPMRARDRYHRWWSNLDTDAGQRELKAELAELWSRLLGPDADDQAFPEKALETSNQLVTPLGDLLTLLSVQDLRSKANG